MQHIKLLILFLVATYTTLAQVGTLDTQFGTNGLTTISLGSYHENMQAVATQSTGKVLVAGIASFTGWFASDWVVSRFDQFGAVDLNFGNTGLGYYRLDNPVASDLLYDMKVLPNDKILICGGFATSASEYLLCVVQLLPDGTPDPNFGTDGKATINVTPGEEYAHKILVHNDGSLSIVGYAYTNGSYTSPVVWRVDGQGQTMTGFGTNGFSVPVSGGSDIYYNIASACFSDATTQNGYVLAGYKDQNFGQYGLVIGLDQNGVLKPGFGSNGQFVTTNQTVFFDVAEQNGQFFVVGQNRELTTVYPALASKFTSTGNYDTSFGTGGSYSFAVPGNANNVLLACQLTNDGQLAVAGSSGSLGFGADRSMLTALLTPGGSFNTMWNNTGYRVDEVAPTWFEDYNAIHQAGDGSIYTAGFFAGSTTGNNGIAAKYNYTFIQQPLTVNLSTIPTTCANISDGSLTWIASGGTPPYTVTVNGNLNPDNPLTGLAAGSFTVIVTDDQGETVQSVVTVQAPPQLTGTYELNVSQLTINVAGGVPPYTYYLSGVQPQTGNVFNNLPDNSYDVTVYDANGCALDLGQVVVSHTNDWHTPDWQVAPTITSGRITLLSEQPLGAAHISVFNTLGQTLLTDHWPTGTKTHTLDLSALPDGMYYIAINGQAIPFILKH
jgi:uncharacterized delta-60 repeat protein